MKKADINMRAAFKSLSSLGARTFVFKKRLVNSSDQKIKENLNKVGF